jgi:Family of unknown function (DUF6132)
MNHKKFLRNIIPVLIGALGGFLYYNYIGCYSGSCAITGNPVASTFYGALIGFVFTDFKKSNKKREPNEN